MFGQGLQISKGKKVSFKGGNIPAIQGRQFLLEEDVQIRFSSIYTPLVEASMNKLWVMGASVVKNRFKADIPVSFKQLGFQQWTSTEPLSLSFTIGIYMNTNAYEDVVVPATALQKLPLPSIIPGANGGLSAPGPDVISALLEDQTFKGSTLTIYLGPCAFDDCIIRGADVTFSQEVDEFGYPIWCKTRIDASSVFTANTGMVDRMFRSS